MQIDRVVESLEQRLCLTSTLTNGVLTIIGSSNKDTFALRQDASFVYVKENKLAEKKWAANSVKSISIATAGGNDLVTMQTSGGLQPVKIPANIAGGSGNDTLRGGRGNDT